MKRANTHAMITVLIRCTCSMALNTTKAPIDGSRHSPSDVSWKGGPNPPQVGSLGFQVLLAVLLAFSVGLVLLCAMPSARDILVNHQGNCISCKSRIKKDALRCQYVTIEVEIYSRDVPTLNVLNQQGFEELSCKVRMLSPAP